jgi:DNA ligase D-like protein (predicted ligase)
MLPYIGRDSIMLNGEGKARFIDPMLLLSSTSLPESEEWQYEIKLDGYRAIAFRSDGKVHFRSRNDHDFGSRYPVIAKALSGLPDETIIDGEVVALDEDGRPSFNLLQNHGSSGVPLIFYVFDVLMLSGREVTKEPLSERRKLLEKKVLPKLKEPVRYSPRLEASLQELTESVKAQGFEGLVAKNLNSLYEPGLRSGAWRKMRVNRGQDFVIGGYTLGGKSFDAVIFGHYQGDSLLYVARTRNGFTPSSRVELERCFRGLVTKECPFANLPEQHGGRWGVGLTLSKMKDCVWLKPELVEQFEFVEWTPDAHLRHARFIALREDKKAVDVRRET